MTLKKLDCNFISSLKFDTNGLIPAIIQDKDTLEVLMLAYMNSDSIRRTLETGKTCFFSRSRQELWLKGETSGNYQHVYHIYYDCDADTLLIMVQQEGSACHTNARSCFFNHAVSRTEGCQPVKDQNIIEELYEVIKDRNKNRPAGSYTTYLFNEGQDKILKKVGEEAAEVIIGSKNNSTEEVVYEMADLMYHCLVLLQYHDVTPDKILEQLRERR